MGASRWPDGRTTQDWYSIAGLLMEMGENLGRPITLCIEAMGRPEKPDLRLTATAAYLGLDSAGPAHSVSTQCRASQTQCATLMGLCIFLLYQLDFEYELIVEEDTSGA